MYIKLSMSSVYFVSCLKKVYGKRGRTSFSHFVVDKKHVFGFLIKNQKFLDEKYVT